MRPNTGAQIHLKKHADKRVARGHAWVYRDEIDTRKTRLADLDPGQTVDVFSHRGRWLGSGYANPKSTIIARVVSRNRDHPFCGSLIAHRLKVALALRDRCFGEPYYRAVFGESDGLPGLVVDRYGDVCVVQITTAGMEAQREAVLRALGKAIRPVGVLFRCDQEIRVCEGLSRYTETAAGHVPQEIELTEHRCRFGVPLLAGQKTGWYYDQRSNRAHLLSAVRGARVLDLFCYTGAWGIQAAVHGAERVVCVDSSAHTVQRISANAKLNGVAHVVRALRMDAFSALEELREDGQRFDIAVLDPPAFVKTKKDAHSGGNAYRRLNQAALRVLARDGLLMTCSCSYHFSREALLDTVGRAARHVDRHIALVYDGGQPADHPVLPAVPETRYLKALLFRVLPRF